MTLIGNGRKKMFKLLIGFIVGYLVGVAMMGIVAASRED